MRKECLSVGHMASLVVASVTLLAACGGGDGGNGPADPVLVVTPTTLDLADCAATSLIVQLEDADGQPIPGATYSFSAADTTVATVSAIGVVTAQGPGTTTIVAGSAGQLVNVPVTVTAVAPSLTGVPDSLYLWPGVADTLAISVADCHGDPVGAVTLTSATPSVAVTAGQVVTGQAYGRSTIAVTGGALSDQFDAIVIGRTLAATAVLTPLGSTPYGVAITASGRVLVTQIGANTVASGQLPGTALNGPSITVGNIPPHVTVTPDGARAFVTNQGSASVSVVDLTLNQTVTTVPLAGEGYNLLATRDGAEVFVTTNLGQTYILDASTGAMVDSFTVGPVSNGLAEHPSQPLMYISSRDAGTVTVFNRQTGVAIDTFVTGGMPQRMAVSPDGTELYVANETLGLDIWNTGTGLRVTSVAMPAYGLALSPDGTQLIVTSAGSTIRLVNVATRAAQVLNLGGGTTRNAAYDATGRTAIITDEQGLVHFLR